MKDFDPLEFKRYVLLGGQVSREHPLFKKLAMLGYQHAETYSFLMWLKYIGEHPDASFEDGLVTLIEYLGMAELMPSLKELTRISMILGDTSKKVSY